MLPIVCGDNSAIGREFKVIFKITISLIIVIFEGFCALRCVCPLQPPPACNITVSSERGKGVIFVISAVICSVVFAVAGFVPQEFRADSNNNAERKHRNNFFILCLSFQFYSYRAMVAAHNFC